MIEPGIEVTLNGAALRHGVRQVALGDETFTLRLHFPDIMLAERLMIHDCGAIMSRGQISHTDAAILFYYATVQTHPGRFRDNVDVGSFLYDHNYMAEAKQALAELLTDYHPAKADASGKPGAPPTAEA